MPATLPEIQARLSEAAALRDSAAETVQDLALDSSTVDASTRIKHVSRLQGYQREVEALQKIERELISNGRADTALPPRTESRFEQGLPETAVITPPDAHDAASAIRGASRVPQNSLSEPHPTPAPLPASGDVF